MLQSWGRCLGNCLGKAVMAESSMIREKGPSQQRGANLISFHLVRISVFPLPVLTATATAAPTLAPTPASRGGTSSLVGGETGSGLVSVLVGVLWWRPYKSIVDGDGLVEELGAMECVDRGRGFRLSGELDENVTL